MRNLHELLINRRSIRRYTDQPLNAESVKLILEAALLSPSSKSTRGWQLTVVDDPAILEALSKCRAAGAGPVAKCSMAVVVAMDGSKSDVWVEDASIAAAYMQLQAADLGLGSCWIQIRNRFNAEGEPSEEIVRELLNIPEQYPVECIVTFGHKDEERKPQDTEKLLWENVHIGPWK